MVDEQNFRLECLRLAQNRQEHGSPLIQAREYANFVLSRGVSPNTTEEAPSGKDKALEGRVIENVFGMAVESLNPDDCAEFARILVVLAGTRGAETGLPDISVPDEPAVPLDANGQEIGEGDLVLHIANKELYRVNELGGSLVMTLMPVLPVNTESMGVALGVRFDEIEVLEKATPKQITLGSMVRIKGGEKFIVHAGHISENRSRWGENSMVGGYLESELELIDDPQ